MRLYKVTKVVDGQDLSARGTVWGANVEHVASGVGAKFFSDGFLYAFEDPSIALLLAARQGINTSPGGDAWHLWECDADPVAAYWPSNPGGHPIAGVPEGGLREAHCIPTNVHDGDVFTVTITDCGATSSVFFQAITESAADVVAGLKAAIEIAQGEEPPQQPFDAISPSIVSTPVDALELRIKDCTRDEILISLYDNAFLPEVSVVGNAATRFVTTRNWLVRACSRIKTVSLVDPQPTITRDQRLDIMRDVGHAVNGRWNGGGATVNYDWRTDDSSFCWLADSIQKFNLPSVENPVSDSWINAALAKELIWAVRAPYFALMPFDLTWRIRETLGV